MAEVYFTSVILLLIIRLAICWCEKMDKNITSMVDLKCYWYDVFMSINKIIFFFTLGFLICRHSML